MILLSVIAVGLSAVSLRGASQSSAMAEAQANARLALMLALGLLLSLLPCAAAEKQPCEVKVAILTLPEGSDGLIHWRAGNPPTAPLQLSTRCFSEVLKLESNVIQFFQDPVLAESHQEKPPEALVTLNIPAGQ